MLNIPGDYLEGGGQILRTALALSCVKNIPFRVYNIRGKRKNSGLKHQHLCAFEICKKISDAETKGLKLGSNEVMFNPGEIIPGEYKADIKTAGGIGLLLQSLLLPSCIKTNKMVFEITGGTCGKYQVPIEYYKGVINPILNKFGLNVELDIVRHGYYPKGGGGVKVEILPSKIGKKFYLMKRGDIVKIEGISHASNFLVKPKVAQRQKETCENELGDFFDVPVDIKYKYEDSLSPGSGITIWAVTDTGAIIGADAIGKKGKPSEEVAKEAVNRLKKEINLGAPVDRHVGDNLIPWLGLIGGEIEVSKVTLHTKTNMWVSELFLGEVFQRKGNIIRV